MPTEIAVSDTPPLVVAARLSPARYKRLLHRACDWVTEWLIYFAILFGPWAFGTTQPWSIEVMNDVGFALGLLWLGKLLIRSSGYQPARWTKLFGNSQSGRWFEAERRFAWLLAGGTLCILLYSLVSAWNARAIYHTDQWSFEYRDAIPWLPHSYDQAGSWAEFWKLVGLAGLFWGLRDWLLNLSPKEAARFEVEGSQYHDSFRLPVRLRRLFLILTVNGTVLAIQGLMQRVEGGDKLLWLIVPRYSQDAVSQFGPYAYRANAAQYFNLLWPAVLGFWWACVSPLRRRKTEENSARQNRLAVLLPCVVIMAICPVVSSSRGGSIVLAINLIMAVVILLMAQWRSRWTAKVLLFLLVAGVVGGGTLVGWKTLAPRMEMIQGGYAGREGLYIAGRYMARDNALFGTGPGTFETMYQLYRRSETDEWLAYMHNDWLEALITFGRVGATPIILTVLLVLSHWFWSGGIYGNKYFVMLLWVSLVGCLVHACFDFPFQIHSVLALFLMLCAVLSCLSRRLAAS
jgi:O-antigen ligase